MNIEELLTSETFLSGNPAVTTREISLGGLGAWSWRVVDASVFATAIREPKGKVTLWKNFHENYVGQINAAVGQLQTHAAHEFRTGARDKVFEVGDILTGHHKVTEFSERLATATGLDKSKVCNDFVSSGSCTFFYTVAALAVLSPGVTYSGLHLALDAYKEGLFPIGLLNIASDPDHDGAPVILCLDPAKLSARNIESAESK